VLPLLPRFSLDNSSGAEGCARATSVARCDDSTCSRPDQFGIEPPEFLDDRLKLVGTEVFEQVGVLFDYRVDPALEAGSLDYL
jgi:hypothetical protein